MKKNNRRHVPQPRRIELDYSEKWGKDVGEATRLALADLKISENEAIVTVLEQPTKGFLGIGAKLAKVRVEKKAPDVYEADTDSDDTDSGDHDAAAQAQATPAATPAMPATPAGETAETGKTADAEEKLSIGKVRDLRKNKGETAVSGGTGRSSGGKPAESGRERSERRGQPDGRGGQRERGRDGERGEKRGRGDEGRNENRNESQSRAYWLSGNSDRRSRPDRVVNHLDLVRTNAPAGKNESRNSAEPPAKSADDRGFSLNDRPSDLRPVSEGNAAENFFREVTGKMGLTVDIRVFENDECVYIEVEGKDSRTVIGKRGQTLDAIQYLTNLVMNKAQENYTRVIVDVEGYRSRREKALEQLAVKLAKKVERTGRNVRLEPMNPYERKVIHATLQSNGQIATRSEGDEPYRRVIIERK